MYVIEERQKRQGSYMPIEEDEHGTYISTPKTCVPSSMCSAWSRSASTAQDRGRTKSPYYVARTCQTYRQAIDDAAAGRPRSPPCSGQPRRPRQPRLYRWLLPAPHPAETQNYLRGHSESDRSQYVGDVVAYDATRGLVEVNVKNKFGVGDRIELILPSGNRDISITQMENAAGEAVEVAPAAVIACGCRYPPRRRRLCGALRLNHILRPTRRSKSSALTWPERSPAFSRRLKPRHAPAWQSRPRRRS